MKRNNVSTTIVDLVLFRSNSRTKSPALFWKFRAGANTYGRAKIKLKNVAEKFARNTFVSQDIGSSLNTNKLANSYCREATQLQSLSNDLGQKTTHAACVSGLYHQQIKVDRWDQGFDVAPIL